MTVKESAISPSANSKKEPATLDEQAEKEDKLLAALRQENSEDVQSESFESLDEILQSIHRSEIGGFFEQHSHI